MRSKKIISAFLAAAMIFGSAAIPADSVIPTFAIEASAASSSIPAPTGLKATPGNKKITLKWNAVRNADGYRVYMYDAATKKYKKIKSVKSNKLTVSDLENGKTYKFKVAAMISLPDSYEVGKLSEAVSATPTASTAKKTSSKMTRVQLSQAQMVGTWEYFNFSDTISYENGASFDVNSELYSENPYMVRVSVLDTSNVVVSYDEEQDGSISSYYQFKLQNSVLKSLTDKNYNLSYKTYECNGDYYMFVNWVHLEGKYSYIFKYVAPEEKTQIKFSKASDLDGTWKTVDFCDVLTIANSDKYMPGHPLFPYDMYLTKMTIKKGIASISYSDGTYDSNIIVSPTTQKVGNCKVKIYEVNGEKYMYYEWVNKYGNFFYILKKSK